MTDLERAKKGISSGESICVVCGEQVFSSEERGIAPLLSLVNRGFSDGASAADKIVGKAAAMLYLFLRPKAVYGEVMTRAAYSLLVSNGIEASCGILTDRIVNRAGTGLCPMEEAVEKIVDRFEAKRAIEARLSSLSRKPTP